MNPMILHTAVDLLSLPPHPCPRRARPTTADLCPIVVVQDILDTTPASPVRIPSHLVLAFLHIDNCATRYASHRNGPSPVCCSRLDLMTTLP